jgi:hypothetical protein
MLLKVSSWTKKFKNIDSLSIYGFYTPKQFIQSHLLRPGSGSGTGSDQKGPDPQHCLIGSGTFSLPIDDPVKGTV